MLWQPCPGSFPLISFSLCYAYPYEGWRARDTHLHLFYLASGMQLSYPRSTDPRAAVSQGAIQSAIPHL